MRSIPLHLLPPIVPPVPREEIPGRIAELRERIAAHLLTRPDWRDFTARQSWAMERERMQHDLTLLERQQEPWILTA